jgi:plasmid replication initiation protein
MKKKTARTAKAAEGSETLTVDISSHGRDEMNLAEFPIAVLADRAPEGAKTLIFRVDHGQLTITGSDAYGLPTAPDADVIVALIQLTKLKNDFKKPTVHFTRYELLRLLGWNNEGRSYRRLDESLKRWVGVTLHYANCWWDNRSKTYGDATLHILESAIILEGKGKFQDEDKQASLPLSSFTWNKIFLESCHADNLKYLDVTMYFSLQHSASKRLYRFLDKRFYKRPSWVFDLPEIAFERVGLSRKYAHNVAKIREKLQPAIDELEQKGFLESLGRDERYFKAKGTWKIRLDKRIARPGLAIPDAAAEEHPGLLKALVERGVTRAKAEDLIRRHAPERIQQKLGVFDWMAERKDKRIGKSPAGWLVKAIEDDYAAPKSYEDREARQVREEARRQRDRQAAEEMLHRREEHERQVEEAEAVNAYLARLTPDERASIEAEAFAHAPEDVRGNLESPELALLRGSLQRMWVRTYVAGKIKQESPTPA